MLFWIGLFAILVVIEILTPIELITIWYMPAVIVCFFMSIYDVSTRTQLITFIIMTIIGTVAMLIYMKKKCKDYSVNLEKYDGIHKITNIDGDVINVRINDVEYNVINNTDEKLKVGDEVKVVDIRGNRLVVKKEN